MRGFHRFHGCGNVQLVFKQNRPLWERAFLGALCTCNGLVCSLQPHLCSFFSFYKDKKRNQKTKKTRNKKKQTQQTASDPLPLGCAICFFGCFFGFLVFCCLGPLFLLRDWQKKWVDLTLCHFPPLGIANLFVVVSACFRSLVPLETM